MGDLLSSASLLVAIVAVLYGFWYPDITRGINIAVPEYKESCDVPLADVNFIITRRALPLVLASLGLTLIFLKDTIRILYVSTVNFPGFIQRALNFDAVSTAFVFVEVLWLCVSIQLIADCIKLAKKRSALKSRPPLNG